MESTADGGDNQSSASVVDARDFIKFIVKVVPAILEGETGESNSHELRNACNSAEYFECIKKFLSDPQIRALIVSKSVLKDEEEDSSGTDSATESERDGRVTYSIHLNVQYTAPKLTSVGFIKRSGVVEADKKIASQLRVLNLSDDSPFETLHSFVSNAIAPYFKSFVKTSGKADRDGDKMVPSVEKKISELEMALLHLQQNIDIPEITLLIHATVINMIKKCQDEERKAKVQDFGDLCEDSSFLNQLQNGVNRWIREIQKVTKLNRDPASGNALQEISFWLNLERALLRIQEKRESFEVALTLDILKCGKRFHATVSFDSDTGLKQALTTVNDYSPLMKDFPLDDLLSATELDKIKSSLTLIFSHLRKIRSTKYPIQRCLRLVEAISRDLSSQLLKVLGPLRLMHIPYEEFDKVMVACFHVFATWDEEYEKLQTLLRDMAKKKREEHGKAGRVNPSHKRSQTRLDNVRKFRRQHEQLRQVIVRVLQPPAKEQANARVPNEEMVDLQAAAASLDPADANAIEEVNLAYENTKDVDALDISKEGNEAWEAAMKRYEERIDRVETRITSRLRDQLGTAKNAGEMFRIFSRFNALFVRPHIQGAIREYQTQLIQRVKDDIETLHNKFKIQYPHSKSSKMSKVRDFPAVSGSIIWARQIERQLNAYLRRVEDVLGKGWESHVEGQRLKEDGDNFKQKLDTQELFEDWSRKVTARNLGVGGRIFAIESTRTRTGNMLKLKVNFLPEIITLAKEVRNLKWLGFRVPLAIVNKAHQANQLYPFAISLIESVRTYETACEKVENKKTIKPLVAGLQKDIQNYISEGIGLTWESYKLDPYVQKFADAVISFQEKVDDLLVSAARIEGEVESLGTCSYDAATFTEVLSSIQKAVDEMNLYSYTNLPSWVSSLDKFVEEKLSVRLQAGLRAWTDHLEDYKEDTSNPEFDSDTNPLVAHKPGGDPEIKVLRHEVRITNQILYLYPPVEGVRAHLLGELHAWLGLILKLPRIQSSRYQVGLDMDESDSHTSYRNLLTKLPDGPEVIERAYQAVEKKVKEVEKYVEVWLRYQSLWDMETSLIYNKLENNLERWTILLRNIRKSRVTFDTQETRQQFGPIIIDFQQVQSKVNLKYDSWHKELLGKFGSMLGTNMQEFYGTVTKSRTDLEQHSVEGSSTSDSVSFITFVQSLKRKLKNWEKVMEVYKNGQLILERQRFQFPSQWLYYDNVEGEWGAFNDILKRKDISIQKEVSMLQVKIIAEDQAVEERTTEFLNEWDKSKPVQGSTRPDAALKSLAVYEGKLSRLKEDRSNVSKAKEALELMEQGVTMISDDRVQIALEELQDLKGIWNELLKIWEKIDEMKEQPWLSVQPRKLRGSLDALLNQLKNFPARLKQYSSYEHVQKLLKGYMKVNVHIVELKSEALKERHWKQLMKQLRVKWVLSDLTLGAVWDVDLVKNEGLVRDVILVAQGEMALEEFLKQVRDVWHTFELDLINYQNKCRVIRGWDDLFTKVKEHLSSVTAMKLSPYYKVFEEDALQWEEKLNRIHDTFDVWIDVQRRWVYLDGIFSGSADIKTLLPVETQRFQSISTEFLTLMKKVSKSPLVIDVLNIQGVQRQLERIADLLGKIQKALGEYLERERASFPRFYFVGDEDLLEIIGNSKSIPKLQKHFKKMFAGVTSITLNEEEQIISGISSKEGEEVAFKTPVSLKEHPKVNEWLTCIEKEMRVTLASLLAEAMKDVSQFQSENIDSQKYLEWVDKYQAQLVVLACQVSWSQYTEAALQKDDLTSVQQVLRVVEATLNVLADSVLHEQPAVRRRKLEHLITELVHQRDVTRNLINNKTSGAKAFDWLKEMRFYFDPNQKNVLKQLSIQMANAKFNYGFEYLGVQDKLVQTPLTDRCYLTMTQALEGRLGGSPFGPAGTGKTESVKALGHQLGRFVLVFNCDETFDFQAMGRIFVGLCQVGAWGCFDEFNRLEERMLSAVSQQIQTIQEALKEHKDSDDSHISIELVSKQVKVSRDMAIFITMNPGYAGRSNLPDNLKKLFRSLAMTSPDRQLIAQVMLYSQGFRMAEKLASKIVPFFKLCLEQLSNQSHYDFGLRALKSVLISAGNVKREKISMIKEDLKAKGEAVDEASISEGLDEQQILIQSVFETVVPKLVAEDIPLLYSLLSDVFPGVKYVGAGMRDLKEEIKKVCSEMYLKYGEGEDEGSAWVDKILQLYQISLIHHGLMMVGPSGSGKSMAWRVLLKALERLEGVEGVAHVIDPKAMSKDELYGTLDPNTREWTDGLFTHLLRKIIDNVRGELGKRQWIIFDGDVDPEWVENLNSVLDDNKLLTLPNGERLGIPRNVRIMFEVQDLRYATLATVSRCGMVWFSEDIVSTEMIFSNYLTELKAKPIEEIEEDVGLRRQTKKGEDSALSPVMQVQNDAVNIVAEHFTSGGFVMKCLEYAMGQEHIMDFTRLRALGSLFSMFKQAVRNVITYNQQHPDFPMERDQLEKYLPRYLVYSLLWSFSGDSKMKYREELGKMVQKITTIPLPNTSVMPLIDYEVTIQGEWVPWQSKVPNIEVETHKVAAPDVVIPTVDTVRHEVLLYTWLAEHKPLVLCGPPGSGKTMTLFCSLRSLPDMEVVGLNFSSATTPELLLKTFDHYCEYRRTPNGVVMAPMQLGKWLVLFCDEINLPDMDNYGTQRVISFLRQMVEHNGFYRSVDQAWVKLERIQFVGACNPPTDPGRKPLTHRFLRYVPVVYVDYPGAISLTQIYGTFNRAMLRLIPSLRSSAQQLTDAMVEFYSMSQERFTQDMQPHYIYSPREMTRWVRGIVEALRPLETLSVEGLVRLWAHEALRLFQDRLVTDEERKWTEENIDAVAKKHFPTIDHETALKRPILYSNWLTKDYAPVEQEELRDFVKARLKVFYEEELDVPLVLFNEVLDHVLRIDRIFKQPQGHLLLIGVSGAGKTTLSRFVAWMNGLSVFQIKIHRKYTYIEFDEDLRNVLRRSGCKNEKVVFILDESNMLESSFLERMNTLLANGEVPGLFEGDEHTTLMTQCKEGSQRDGLMLDSSEELYKWFTEQVIRNLHVVFTMNPSSEGLKDRAATSPALFNRCVLNWFGDWSTGALYQVGKEFTSKIDLDNSLYRAPDYLPVVYEGLSIPPTHREAVINAFVFVHQTLHQANARLAKRGGRCMAITPRHYLDFINHYVKLYNEKRSDLEEQQLHLNVGLQKIKETVDQVEELQKSLSMKSQELEAKNALANQKLKQMLKEQQEAEKKRMTSTEIQAAIAEQTTKIKEKKALVMEDLAQVEPAVRDAKQAVKSIKKQHLVEVRSMANPPQAVKVALESICLLLGEQANDWRTIRGIIIRDNFISTIVNFQTENISEDVRAQMLSKYMSQPDYNFDKVNRASQACGPLVKWAIAQVKYADMLLRIEPLRNELKSLESEAGVSEAKAAEIAKVIAGLEKSISQYKEEYAALISQAQAIKSEMTAVEAKVNRSVALLRSLSDERSRWQDTSNAFQAQMGTIVGDVMLSSAFLAYAGYFDQQLRQNLFTTWSSHLQQAGLEFRQDLARTEYLSTADERLAWQANALPTDDLCTENAIMLKRFNRYPLIIDPSGQATEFIMNEYKARRITKTSFLDDAFRKNLESALRFGNPLLVQDVENYDPIVNPVLNREVRRTGGRVLITMGDQDIDLSPSFTIFMSTRDPTVEFPPDLCSRVTFVNFTVTRSSLHSQCLNYVLKAERQDVDTKRSDLLKLQGEFHLRLRHLEKSLLQALNDVKGRILDDDSIIGTLEKLKQEAAEITKKVEETDAVMAEVEAVTDQYRPLSQSCSSIYFTMESLNLIYFLYQYSLQFFLDMYLSVLHENPNLNNLKDNMSRLNVITTDVFQIVYNRVSRGMLHDDRITFALLLCRIYLRALPGEREYEEEFSHFLEGRDALVGKKSAAAAGLSPEQSQAMSHLAQLVPFNNLPGYIQSHRDFFQWSEGLNPENNVPVCWESNVELSALGNSLYQLLVVQAFRPDRVLTMVHKVVETVFGQSFLRASEQELDVAFIVEKEIKSNTPILMCSVPGHDASGRVDDLVAQQNKQCTAIAIGSAEGFNLAEKAVNSAVKSGRWVLLKNVHLAPQWLVTLEKKLHTLNPHANFRLFLTMEINPKVPVNLLRASRVFVFEPPPGIKANLFRTFSTIPAARMCRAPTERTRLYFLLAWLHAIIQERLRYAPLGWSKHYEFSESDLRVACDTIDTWLDNSSQGRTNISPDKVPWDALRTLLTQAIYGGRIDNEFDQRLLSSFVNRLFTVNSFESDFPLVLDVDGVKGKNVNMPDGIRREQFVQWTEKLPDYQSPSWLGLPNNAEKLLLTVQGQALTAKLLKMQNLEDEEELAYSPGLARSNSLISSDARPAWMRTLHTTASNWLAMVPEKLAALKRTNENIKDPLFRFFEREILDFEAKALRPIFNGSQYCLLPNKDDLTDFKQVNVGIGLLTTVRNDLQNVISVCEQVKKPTNYLRSVMSDLMKAILPKNWQRYTVTQSLTVIQWIADFSDRVQQLQQVSQVSHSGSSKGLKNMRVRLGWLFVPEAYITATRQYVAQANNWSLEELFLKMTVSRGKNDEVQLDDCSFGITGLRLQGANCVNNRLELAAVISTDLPLTSLSWIRTTDEDKRPQQKMVTLPVYLNQNRRELLFTVDMEFAEQGGEHRFYERGVAFLASSMTG